MLVFFGLLVVPRGLTQQNQGSTTKRPGLWRSTWRLLRNGNWLLFMLASWMRVTLGYQLLVRMPIRVRANMPGDPDCFSYVA